MNLCDLLHSLFPAGHTVELSADGLLTGFADTDGKRVAVMGSTDHLAIGVESALTLAAFVLQVVRDAPDCPILMLVDTQGQRLSKRDELLGINGYLAHLVKCLELARVRGHRLVTLVYAEAVSGGFLAYGLMADEIYSLDDAQVRVMNLPAMSRITKLPLEQLTELSASSPSFAPGVQNFYKLGGVKALWHAPLDAELRTALERPVSADCRREDGLSRQGRLLASGVARRIRDNSVQNY